MTADQSADQKSMTDSPVLRSRPDIEHRRRPYPPVDEKKAETVSGDPSPHVPRSDGVDVAARAEESSEDTVMISVTINGHTYPVACPRNQREKVLMAAGRLGELVADMARSDRRITNPHLLVLVGLLLNHRLTDLQNETTELRERADQSAQWRSKLLWTQDQIDKATQSEKQMDEALKARTFERDQLLVRVARWDQRQAGIEREQDQIKKIREALNEREREIEAANVRVSDLGVRQATVTGREAELRVWEADLEAREQALERSERSHQAQTERLTEQTAELTKLWNELDGYIRFSPETIERIVNSFDQVNASGHQLISRIDNVLAADDTD